MITSFDAFPVNMDNEIEWEKAIPIDVESLSDTHCTLFIVGYGKIVVDRKRLSNSVLLV